MVNGINTNNISNISRKPDMTASKNNASTPATFVSNQIQSLVTPAHVPMQPKSAESLGEVKIPGTQNAHVYKLGNGQKLVVIPKQGPVTVNTFVKVGSINEPDNIRGISHYIEHNLFNGSSQLKSTEFVDSVKKVGGIYNASTGFASTNYFISLPVHSKEDLDKMLAIHADMLEAPTFSPEMLEKEKAIVSSEIQMLEDNPSQKADNILLRNLFGIETSSTDLIGGTVSNIQNLNKNTVDEYYKKYYTPDNMVTVVAGDVKPDEIATKLNKLFISRRPASKAKIVEPLKPLKKTYREDQVCNGLNSASVNVGFVGAKNNSAKGKIVTNALLMAIAGDESSRLSRDLEKFNTYAMVHSEAISNAPEDPGAIMINVPFQEGRQEEGLRTIYSSLNHMKYEPISDMELDVIKEDMKRSYKEAAESSMMLTQMVGAATLSNDVEDINNTYQMIDQLTSRDIQQAAKDYLDLNKASIVVFHPPKKDVNFTGAFHSDAVDKLDLGNVETYELKNNIEVDYQHSDAPFSYVSVLVKNDALQNQKPGCDLLLSEMLNMGSAYLGKEEFRKKALAENTDVFFSAKNNRISISTKSDGENVNAGIDFAKQVLLAPNLTEENLEKAKAQLKLDFESSQKTPQGQAIEELFPGNSNFISYQRGIENLDNITIEDVKELYSGILSGARAKVTVTAPGNQKQKSLANLQNIPLTFNQYSYRFNPDSSALAQNKVLVQSEERNQAEIEQIYKIENSGNIKDIATFMVLNSVLSDGKDGLFEDLREKQKLAYAVRSSFTTNNEDAILQLRIKTTTQDPDNGVENYNNVQKSLDGFKKHVDGIVQTPINEEELNTAKLAILSRLIFDTESSEGKHRQIAGNSESFYGTEYTKELTQAIQNVTAEDIQTAARVNLTKPSIVSIVASPKTLDANKDYLANFGVIEQA